MTTKPIKAAVLGGGTGSATVARGLRPDAFIAAILTTCDDGGSSRPISEGLGIGPVGDIRQFLLALADPRTEADLAWRFPEPPFSGHPLGNIELAGLIKMHGVNEGIRRFCDIHRIVDGIAVPMTPGPLRLCLRKSDGQTVVGESQLGEFCAGEDYFRADVTPDLRLQPTNKAVLCPEAIGEIETADLVVVPPGKLTSVGPLMLVEGMREALLRARGRGVPIMGVVNIMTLLGQTDGLSAAGHIRRLEELLGGEVFTHVLINTRPPSPDMVAKYAKEGEEPVVIDPAEFAGAHYQVVAADLLSDEIREQNPADLLLRTVLRHDPRRLADLITETALAWQRCQK